MPPVSRRAFLAKYRLLLAPALLGAAPGAYTYGGWERHRLTVERRDTALKLGKAGPSKMRLVTLSDFHFDPLYEVDFAERYVQRANTLNPDLVFLTGDFVTGTSKRVEELAEVLGGLKAKSGVFACLGNHDHWNQPHLVRKALESSGIDVLANQHARVPVQDGEAVIVGLESGWGGRPSWLAAAKNLSRDDRPLVLMHEPDHADYVSEDSRAVLQCSGHTHGGQVRIPGYGALVLPSHGKKYEAGFYQVKNLRLYVNRGVGTVDQHIRFCCPPEIACLDIVNTDRVSARLS